MVIVQNTKEYEEASAIVEKYRPQLEKIKKDLQDVTEKDERQQILIRQQTVFDELQNELDALNDRIQQERFAEIQKGGKAAIIAHGREQIPQILNILYKGMSQDYATLDAATLKRIGLGDNNNGVFRINADYAAQIIKSELRLHISALEDDKDALQELLERIIEEVENSPFTDSTEVTGKSAAPSYNLRRFRRLPLVDITTFGLMNDKASTQLIQEASDKKQIEGQLTLLWKLNQAPKAKEEVPVYISLTYNGTDGLLTKSLTAFDIAVYNAVATRFYYWQKTAKNVPLYITPQEIWRDMNGKRSGNAKPSKGQTKRICDSIDKMRFTRFYMDISKEIEAFDLQIEDERIIGGTIDGYLLNATKSEFYTDKGNVVTGYRISEEPLLYTYNAIKNHILYLPYELLDTSTKTIDSENVTEFKYYLLRQIELMKNGAEGNKPGRRFHRSTIVLLETIYRETGIQPPEERAASTAFSSASARQTYIRKTRAADRVKIEGLLDVWTEKGWIKGYTVLNAKDEPIKPKQQAKGYRIHI